MEMADNVELTKEQNLMELMELLRKNNMQEAANNIFEMAAYVDVMENKMDSILDTWSIISGQYYYCKCC